MELFHASHQWATRPDDQRFNSLQQLYDATRAYALAATERTFRWSELRVETGGEEGNLFLTRGSVPATLTHYSFGQLCSRVSAPASYLRGLPPTLAAQNINHGLKHRSGSDEAKLLFHENGNLLLRAITGTVYERVWNYEVVSRLMELADRVNLIPGQETFSWADRSAGGDGPDVAPSQDADKALYASDHDMFVFLMTPDRTVVDPVGQPMRRGVMVRNSEVGNGSLWLMSFYFRDVCGNHIIWGAKGITEVRMPHVGKIRDRWWNAEAEVRRYLDADTSFEQAAYEQLRVKIADDKDSVLDKLFGIRSLGLSRKALEASYDAVQPDQDGDPNTVWGMAQGITRHAQGTPYADDRTELDRAAGKLLAYQF